jgi:hypothetical protein
MTFEVPGGPRADLPRDKKISAKKKELIVSHLRISDTSTTRIHHNRSCNLTLLSDRPTSKIIIMPSPVSVVCVGMAG